MIDRPRVLLAVVVIGGAALRLHGLALDGLYVDELHSMQLAWVSWPEAADSILHHPPLFYLLLKAWRSLAGDSLFAMRLLGALLSTATLLLSAALARRLWDRQTALLATALIAFSDLQIFFAREIKGHALLTLLSVGALYLFVRYLDDRGHRALLGSAVCALGAMYTHYTGLLLPLGLAAFMLLRRPPGQAAFWASQLIYLGYLPWIRQLWRDLSSFAEMSHRPFTLTDLGWILQDLLPGGLVSPGPILLLLAALAAALWAARRDPRLQLLLCAIAATGLLPIAASFAGVKMVEFARHLLPAHLLLLLLAARGALTLEHPALRRGLASGLLACQLLPLCLAHMSPPPKSDWTAVSRYLESHTTQHDAIMVTNWHFLHETLQLIYGGDARLYALNPLPLDFSMRQQQQAWSDPEYFSGPEPLRDWFATLADDLPRERTTYLVLTDQPGHRRIHRTVLSLLVRQPGMRAQLVLGAGCQQRFAPSTHYCAMLFVVRLTRR